MVLKKGERVSMKLWYHTMAAMGTNSISGVNLSGRIIVTVYPRIQKHVVESEIALQVWVQTVGSM